MRHYFNRKKDFNYSLALAQEELLEALLESDDAPYPWNTADPESEVYFEEREQEFLLEDWSEGVKSIYIKFN